jgi:four helix bundle protein
VGVTFLVMDRIRVRRGHQRLTVWVRAMELTEAVYKEATRFPDHERYGLSAQMRRASVSIPCNIAEGYGRSSRREYLRHLSIANGSLLELETQVLVAHRVGYLARADADTLLGLASEVGRMLARMSTSPRSLARAPAPAPLNPER